MYLMQRKFPSLKILNIKAAAKLPFHYNVTVFILMQHFVEYYLICSPVHLQGPRNTRALTMSLHILAHITRMERCREQENGILVLSGWNF